MSEWISVDDKYQPPIDEDVLVIEINRLGEYWVAHWDGSHFIENQECMIIEATHWMTLPSPP